MSIVNTLSLESNREIKLNFDGGDLSSDAGLLLIKEFAAKKSLASQPTISRFFTRMDKDTLLQFDDIDKSLRDIIYAIKSPEHMLLDLDSTLFGTYGNQEGEGFNFHYQAHGYSLALL